MDGRALAVVVVVLVVAGCTGSPLGSSEPAADGNSATATTPATTTTTATTATTQTVGEQPRVVVRDDETGEALGNVTVELAETADERYTGLSEHESLGENEGMLFVYVEEGERTFVMRSMDFPIDIVYVGADGHITEIHHAETEADDEDLTPYPGRGKWVLEVPYNWTVERGVEAGDRVVIHDGE